ncbi:MAG: hypothetical protein ABI947_21610 [Chloroflexota bacterium]
MNYFNYTDDEMMELREILAENLGLTWNDLDNLSDEGAVELAIMHDIIVPDEETMYNIRWTLAEIMQVPMENFEAVTDQGIIEMAARYGAL